MFIIYLWFPILLLLLFKSIFLCMCSRDSPGSMLRMELTGYKLWVIHTFHFTRYCEKATKSFYPFPCSSASIIASPVLSKLVLSDLSVFTNLLDMKWHLIIWIYLLQTRFCRTFLMFIGNLNFLLFESYLYIFFSYF